MYFPRRRCEHRGSNNNNDANDNDGGVCRDNDVVADGGYNPDSQGTNDTENDGGTDNNGCTSCQTNLQRAILVAIGKIPSAMTCQTKCTSTQGIGYGQEYHYDNSHELAFLEIGPSSGHEHRINLVTMRQRQPQRSM